MQMRTEVIPAPVQKGPPRVQSRLCGETVAADTTMLDRYIYSARASILRADMRLGPLVDPCLLG